MVGYRYSGGQPSVFRWAVCILVGYLNYDDNVIYSAELSLFSCGLSTEIVDYFDHWLQIVCPHFA